MPDEFHRAMKEIQALGRDHRSGAAEIVERAARLLLRFARRGARGVRSRRWRRQLRQLAQATRKAQSSMAPVLNLAALVERTAAQRRTSPPNLARALADFRRQVREANEQIARRFAARVQRHSVVLTYSYSSTVLAALRAARWKITQVICSEGRPQLEGRRLAAKLARGGIPVVLVADAALPGRVRAADVVVVGADAVFPKAYANKIGTEVLQRAALAARKPFYVLADTSKTLSAKLARFYRIEEKPTAELWRQSPRRVRVENRYFERIPRARGVVLLTERGPLTRQQKE